MQTLWSNDGRKQCNENKVTNILIIQTYVKVLKKLQTLAKDLYVLDTFTSRLKITKKKDVRTFCCNF